MDHIVALADLDKDERENVPHASSASYIIRWIALSKASQGGVDGLIITPAQVTCLLEDALFGEDPSFQTACTGGNLYKSAILINYCCIDEYNLYKLIKRQLTIVVSMSINPTGWDCCIWYGDPAM